MSPKSKVLERGSICVSVLDDKSGVCMLLSPQHKIRGRGIT